MSNITLNIVEPGSPTPDPVVPNTGLFTSGIGGAEAAVIATITLVAILAIIGAVIYYKKKAGKGSTPSLLAKCRQVIKSKKHAPGLAVLALLVSIGTVAGLVKLTTSAIEGSEAESTEDSSALTVDVSSTELTIELADDPVFAVLPVELTVAEATEAGYTLTAYTEDTNLVSTTDESKIIPMVVADKEGLVALTANTYGLSLLEPESETDEIYTALSTDSSSPTVIKSMPEYTPTEENDTTTIYYGFYITPDIPYGTYTNDGEVYYNATINTTLVTFDGKGLYFDEEQTQSTNTVEYIAVSQDNNETETSSTINQPISGEYKTPSQSLPYRFLGWSTDPEATVPTYTSEDDIAEHLPISPNIPLTLYAVWQKATTITFDNNGGAGEMDKQTIIAGESANLSPNTFTRDGYTFNGWNTDEHGEGKSYTDEELYQAEAESANVTLFAQWKKNLPSMQDVATWGSTLTQGNEITVVDSRDGKEYTVARLADNNIWMTQNLDHDIVSTPNFYTYENTDIGHGTIPDPTATWTGTATYPTGATTWNWSNTTPESYDPGDLYWNGNMYYNQETCEVNGGTWQSYGVCETYDIVTSHTGNVHYHLGNYYNWTAAIAMSDSTDYTSGDVDQSICPAGWMLPKGGDTLIGSGSFQYLVNKADLTAGIDGNIHIEPPYFNYSISWIGQYSQGSSNSGVYFSSVTLSDDSAYSLLFWATGDIAEPQESYGSRGAGNSVRCMAR